MGLQHRGLIKVSTGLSLLITIQVALGPAASAANASFEAGIKAYQGAKYEDAKAAFQKSIKTNKGDVQAHYYLANTLMYLKDGPGALQEYKACLALKPDPQTQSLAQRAVYYLTQPPAAAAPAEDADPDAALSAIKRQAEEEKSHSNTVNELSKKAILEKADNEAKKLTQQSKDNTNQLMDSTISQNESVQSALKGQADAQKKELEDQAKKNLDNAKNRANGYTQAQETKKKTIDDVVTSLESQMKSTSSNSVRLNPAGTNLYIRNYSNH